MKIKLDEHLPNSLAEDLRSLGHDAVTVIDQGWAGWADEKIWPSVVEEGRMLVTCDVQFADARRCLVAGSPGVILVRMADASILEIRARVIEVLKEHDIARWSGCCATITPSRVRVRRSVT